MSTYIQNFMKFRPLLGELIARDIKIKYRRSVLGVVWTLLNPLLMMIVLSIVFSNLFRFDVENFPLYILSGQLVFNFFSSSTTDDMTAILNNGALIKKVYVPKYLFVLSRTISSLVNLLASFSALLMIMLVMRSELYLTIFLFFIPLTFLAIFSLGVGLFLAAITVRFRDIMHLYSVFTTALMYLTPVIYPMSILPHTIKIIVEINPLTNMLIMFRNIMFENTPPSWQSLLLAAAESVVMLAIGLYVFYKNQDEFILNI